VSTRPPPGVLDAFGVEGPTILLVGGEGRSWRADGVVLKPAPSEAEWEWLGAHLPTVREAGFRLALPVPALDGSWVIDGWCAQGWLAGAHPTSPVWTDVLRVSTLLHDAMRHLPRPAFVDERTHHWAVADRIAWGNVDGPTHPVLDRLLALRRPIDLPAQAIHGDLTENVLDADGDAPAVIDPTIYWRPAGYASAIVVGDAVRWFDAEPEPLLDSVSAIDVLGQLMVRASIFRLVTTLLFGGDIEPYERDLDLIDLVGV
jgi:uncharacterized protein (TIGR02569 family)